MVLTIYGVFEENGLVNRGKYKWNAGFRLFSGKGDIYRHNNSTAD